MAKSRTETKARAKAKKAAASRAGSVGFTTASGKAVRKKVARKKAPLGKQVRIAPSSDTETWRKEISPQQIVAVRNQLHLTQDEFAKCIFATSKSLKNWEQGVAKPNAQAAVLIQLVGRYPQLLEEAAEAERLERIERQKGLGDRLMLKYAGALAELAK